MLVERNMGVSFFRKHVKVNYFTQYYNYEMYVEFPVELKYKEAL